MFIDGELPNNYCRTALDEAQYEPWCYTTDENERYSECGLRDCGNVSA